MSNSVFNFSFLAVVVSEIIWAPKFTLGGSAPYERPLAENVCTQSEHFTISNCAFNFNFLAQAVFETFGDPKFTSGALRPWTPLAEICLHPNRVLYHVLILTF